MYGVYDDIINAAERAVKDLDETRELLEYPEVQADKGYYLSVLSKYNDLNFIFDRLTALKQALCDGQTAKLLLAEADTDGERAAVYAEISAIKRKALSLSAALSDALGCRHVEERACCRFKFTAISAKFGTVLYELIKADLLSRGAAVSDEKSVTTKGYVSEISFIAEGADVMTRLLPFSGAHKVYIAGTKSEELCFAVTPAATAENISENDLKIDVFHSHGAGGQNINKVETAVRITHLPTGLSVVCQDERSQLKNKKRALENIEKKLKDKSEQSEKKRIEADISAQFCKKNTPLSFDAAGFTMTDTRLSWVNKIPFPPKDFTSYLNGLTAL